MPRINVVGVDAASRKKYPREFSLVQELGGEAVESEVSVPHRFGHDGCSTDLLNCCHRTVCRLLLRQQLHTEMRTQ